MPRQFSAPIPVNRRFDIDTESMVYEGRPDLIAFINRSAIWIGFKQREQVLEDPDLARLVIYWPLVESLLRHIQGIYSMAFDAVRRAQDDALQVDDAFLLGFNQPIEQRLSSLIVDRAEAFRVDRKATFTREFESVVDAWAPSEDLPLSQEQVFATLFHESLDYSAPVGKLPCPHPQPHKRLPRRKRGGRQGPKYRTVRRASTWATYALSWVLGSEALAVRLWNTLPLPQDLRWSAQSSPAVSLALYSDAKKRLVDDLTRWQMIPTEIALQPNPPLKRDVVELLEWTVKARTESLFDQLFDGLTSAYN